LALFLFISISIILNVVLITIFKLYNRFDIDNLAAITINYFTCYLTAAVYIGDLPTSFSTLTESWFYPAIILSVVFIAIFNLTAICTQQLGMAKTIVYQKMSLIAPALIGLTFYGEIFSWQKSAGILLAIGAVYCLSGLKPNSKSGKLLGNRYGIFGILVFLGSCLIDGSLYLLEAKQIVANADVNFVAHLFLFAGIFGALFIILKKTRHAQITIGTKEILGGIALGIPNFFTIYLIFKILDLGFEGSSFFPIQNVGILALATLTGILIFKERLSRLNIIGLVMALLTIILLSY